MDQKDIQILKTALSEGTSSPDEIHEHTEIPKSTVHYRLNQLREEGILEDDLFDMDLSKLGLSITIISEVYAEFDEGYHETVGEKLADVEGINQVYFTMGDTDFVAIGHVTDRAMVELVVKSYESIDQIQRTSSKFVISTVKTSDTRSTTSNGRRSSRRSPGSDRSLRPVGSLRRAVDTV